MKIILKFLTTFLLFQDQKDGPAAEKIRSEDLEEFTEEQSLMARLVHQFQVCFFIALQTD